ncbi:MULTISPECIES: restriction endonuclease [unclassified Methanoculleus]|uniref:restriction endonuclease n=1 Tax=unclassified Methanoculleus TaxID=2619537 RepID=UPI0025E601FE|nr:MULTISPECIES: restriction endonuclease [unclassified Methanoculleus]MCK9318530.1 restriction endonuclease [Methanoculleus sp.]MDD2254371.1 restriction endonuclease [Methanoculleus sp.]MDD2787027.1 restriction endonuclease [Methanoculleus sp.]MDD3215181.1 restriction endonuclease [Methanoculleus sp.]MDD4314903.1 restriction endonuclease [Methanoculleus sp.]
MKHVTKADGTLQPFDSGRVRRTLRNMGLGEEDADRIAGEIEEEVLDGVRTAAVLRMIRARARAVRPAVAHRTNLRRALALLRPKPEFEEFVRVLLREHGYRVETGCILAGRCGEHEVDAIAYRDAITFFVEVKHHANHHRMTGLDEGRIARAIVEDLQEGFRSGRCSVSIDGALIVCNTKLSEHAKRYATCRGIGHIGWDYPEEKNLRTMIEDTGSYPVTIVSGVSPSVSTRLAAAGILTAKQVAYGDAATIAHDAGLSLRETLLIAERARAILEP